MVEKYVNFLLNDNTKKRTICKVTYVDYNNFFKYNRFDHYPVSDLSPENIKLFFKIVVPLLEGDFDNQDEHIPGYPENYTIHINEAGDLAVSYSYTKTSMVIHDLDIKNKIGNMLVHDNNDIGNRQVNLSPKVEINEEIMSSPTAEIEHYDYLATLFKNGRMTAYCLISGDEIEAHIKGAVLARKYNSTCYIAKIISAVMPTDSVEHVVVTDQEVSN